MAATSSTYMNTLCFSMRNNSFSTQKPRTFLWSL